MSSYDFHDLTITSIIWRNSAKPQAAFPLAKSAAPQVPSWICRFQSLPASTTARSSARWCNARRCQLRRRPSHCGAWATAECGPGEIRKVEGCLGLRDGNMRPGTWGMACNWFFSAGKDDGSLSSLVIILGCIQTGQIGFINLSLKEIR